MGDEEVVAHQLASLRCRSQPPWSVSPVPVRVLEIKYMEVVGSSTVRCDAASAIAVDSLREGSGLRSTKIQ